MKVIVEYFNRRPSREGKPFVAKINGVEYAFTPENKYRAQMEDSTAAQFCSNNVAAFRIVSAVSQAALSIEGEEGEVTSPGAVPNAVNIESNEGLEGEDPNAGPPKTKEQMIADLMDSLSALGDDQIREYIKTEQIFSGLSIHPAAKRETVLNKVRAFLTDKEWN